MQWKKYLLVLLVLAETSVGRRDHLVVNTNAGKVMGETVSTAIGGEVDAWYSIPYAKPPVGELRFRHPRPIDRWFDIKDTRGLPNSCWQISDTFFGDFEGATMWNPNTPVSEDCLYLSVIVPKPRSKNVPVVVSISGLGFFSGTSTLPLYDYRILAQDQNVIIVAPQYRLANLGFMYLETSDVPGNSGLYDQLLALQWIKDNIAFFGGNPNSITLMGHSAGAAAVGMHLISPLSQNLFNQAIMESGSANVPWSIVEKRVSKLRAQKLAKAVSCPTELNYTSKMIECLRSKNASELIYNEPFVGVVDFPFVPIVDGAFFDETPIESLKKGNFKTANILLGSNTEEGYSFLMYFLPELFRREKNVEVSQKNFRESIGQLFPNFNELAIRAILHEYTDWLDPDNGDKNRNALDKMVGDYHFTCNVNEFARYFAETGKNVYKYYFKHRSSGNLWPKWTGTLHGDEISFLFGRPLDPKYRHFTEKERELSRKMMTYWGNFIKSG